VAEYLPAILDEVAICDMLGFITEYVAEREDDVFDEEEQVQFARNLMMVKH
jgi:hypothetical protein